MSVRMTEKCRHEEMWPVTDQYDDASRCEVLSGASRVSLHHHHRHCMPRY